MPANKKYRTRTRAKKPTSQKRIIEIDPLCCPIHTFMLFLDALDSTIAQERYIQDVSLRLVEVLCAFLQFESSKSGPKNGKSE